MCRLVDKGVDEEARPLAQALSLWFEQFRKRGSTRLEYGGHINAPFELLTGGYIGAKLGYNIRQWMDSAHRRASTVHLRNDSHVSVVEESGAAGRVTMAN